MKTLLPFFFLVVAWLLWSGHFTFSHSLVAFFGLVSCVGVGLLARRMDRCAGSEPLPLGSILRSVPYLPWLVLEILKANLDVAKAILAPRPAIQPRLLSAPTSQKTDLGQVIYANSITLTPGTVTLDLREGRVLVHALTEASAAGVLSGEMDAKVTKLEGRA